MTQDNRYEFRIPQGQIDVKPQGRTIEKSLNVYTYCDIFGYDDERIMKSS
jgi:hypothetical protein